MIDDYHQSSLHSPIAPMLVQLATGYEPQAAIRIAGTDYARVVSGIGGIWKNSFPDRPFDYAFLDQVFDNHYRAEANMGRALTVFAALAIIISVLGLLGLTIIALEKRQKEIAIRKVLGASAAGLVGLLSADFAKLLVLALLTAIPLSWTIMNKWLNNFAYRTAITWWLYLGSGLLLMIVAILTVGTLAYKATSNNPAKSLRID
jgi:putative ABC transport system permease protein